MMLGGAQQVSKKSTRIENWRLKVHNLYAKHALQTCTYGSETFKSQAIR